MDTDCHFQGCWFLDRGEIGSDIITTTACFTTMAGVGLSSFEASVDYLHDTAEHGVLAVAKAANSTSAIGAN